MNGQHFPVDRRLSVGGCSMTSTEELRKYAAEQGIAKVEALKLGMEERPKKFVEKGAGAYGKV